MSEAQKESPPKKLTPAEVLNGESPLVLTAMLEPIVGDRFQPAGFPEIGHVIYKAPREDGSTENVCIVDSVASMANHLERVCQRSAHDLELVDELRGMPYIRCVTNGTKGQSPESDREVVVTSLTEGHRIASSMFLDGKRLENDSLAESTYEQHLVTKFGIEIPKSSKAHPPAERMWDVFTTIFEADPNSLVHGVLFPQWQIKIPRALTAHLEALGASRVDRSGVKFDKGLGPKSDKRVQAIFAVDDTTAESIRATFILDVSLIRSFGRKKDEKTVGLLEKQQEFLVALALWKIQKLLESPFRFRSGCHLRCAALSCCEQDVRVEVKMAQSIKDAGFAEQPITDVFWLRGELYREGEDEAAKSAENDDASDETEG